MIETFEKLAVGTPTREKLLDFYDTLSAVPIDFMPGVWRGGDWATGTKLDGLLERSGWYGKIFRTSNDVEGLVFSRPRTILAFLNYLTIWPFRVPERKGSVRHPLGKARLREVGFRGKVSAAMCYNYLPIIDHFRLIDDDTVIGLMDLRGRRDMELFFWLRRVTGES